MAVLLIFPVILQTVINFKMLSTGERGERRKQDAANFERGVYPFPAY